MNITEFRQKYPQYSNKTDDELSRAVHAKHYADKDYGDFAKRFNSGFRGAGATGTWTEPGTTKSRFQKAGIPMASMMPEPGPRMQRIGQAAKEVIAAPVRSIESMLAGGIGGLIRMAGEKAQVGPRVAENVARLGRLTGKLPGDAVSVEGLIRKHGLNKPYAFYDRKMKQLAESGKKIQDFWDEQANKGWEAPNPDIVEARWRDRPVSKSVSAISSGITSIGVVVGTTALTKSTSAGLALLASSEAGSMYGRLRDKKVPIDVASKLSLMAGAWTMATEKIGFDKLLKPSAFKFTNILKKSGWEGLQEVVEGMGHNLLEYFGYDYRKPSDIPTAVKASYDHIMDNFMDNLVGGMGAGGAVSLVTSKGRPAVKPPTVEELTGKSVREIEVAAEKVGYDLSTPESRKDVSIKVTARAKEIADKLGFKVTDDDLFTTVTAGKHNRGISHGDAGISMFLNKDATQEQIDRIIIHELGHTISPKKTKGLSNAHEDEVRIRKFEEEQIAKLKGIEAQQPAEKGKETLTGAAIRLKSGETLTGTTHADILRDVQASGRTIANEEFDIPDGSGFVTSEDRFVSPAEGYNIAESSKQFKSTGDKDVDAQFKKARHLVAENVEFDSPLAVKPPTVEELTGKKTEEIIPEKVVGDKYTGPAWRAEPSERYSKSEFAETGRTLEDIITWEYKELGNEHIAEAYDVLDKLGLESEDIPADRLVWVSDKKEFAEGFGGYAEEINIPGESTILSDDKEGGYLLLLPDKYTGKLAGKVSAEIPEGIMARKPYKLKKGEQPITDDHRKALRENGYSVEHIIRLSPKEAKAVAAGHTLDIKPDGSRVTPATLVVDQLKTLPRTQPTEGERRRMSSLMKAYTTVREKVSNYILNQDIMLKFSEILDGYNPDGPIRKFIFDPIKRANVKARDNITKVMDGFADTFREQGIDFGGMITNTRTDVVAGFPLTDTERIGIYLLSKNENGRRRAESWFDEEGIDNAKAVDLVVESVLASDKETTVAATVEAYRDVMSPRFFDAATEMGFKDVKREENYLMLLTEDQDEVSQSPIIEQLASFAGGKVKTPGERSVKERTGTAARAKIDLADIFPEMVRAMERFIEVGPIAAKVGRSMDNPAFKIALNNATRGQGYKVMRSWLEDSTRGSVERESGYWSKWIKNRRRNAVPYLLGYKMATVVPKQAISTANTIAKRPALGPAIIKRLLAYGDMSLLGNLKRDKARVFELSAMMRNRDWHRDLTRLYDKKDTAKLFKGKRLSPLSMAPTIYVDSATVTASWLAAYEQALVDLNGDSKASVKYADDLITEGHPMGNVEDMAGFFRGGTLEKLVTTFMNQPNKNWNFLRHEIYNKMVQGKISKQVAMQRFVVGQIMPAIVLGTITRGRLPESVEEVAKDIASFMLGGLVFFGRWVYNVVTGDWDPIKSAFSTVPFKALEEAGRTVSSAAQGNIQKTAEHAVGTYGAFTGKIPQQIITTTGGMIDLMQGETDDYKRLIYSKYMLKRNKPKSDTAGRKSTMLKPPARGPR